MVSGDVQTALLLTCMGACGTALGGLLVVAQPGMDFRRLGLLQGLAGGLMFSISFIDLLPQAIAAEGFATANVWFFAGVLFFAACVAVIPEPSVAEVHISATDIGEDTSPADFLNNSETESEKRSRADKEDAAGKLKVQKRERKAVLFSGIVTAIGIALHNFPEGVAVFMASMKSPAVGLSLALAIALHNIPEGVAVALPVYFATHSRWLGFKYAFLSGLAEPLAVVFLAFFCPFELSQAFVERMLAAVAGIMAFLTLHELLPLAFKHAGRTAAIVAFFTGMALMSVNLWLLEHWLMAEAGSAAAQ